MRLYYNFLIFCPRYPPFRKGPTVADMLPHVLWAELRFRSGLTLRAVSRSISRRTMTAG